MEDFKKYSKIITSVFKPLYQISITGGLLIGIMYFTFYAEAFPSMDGLEIINYILAIFSLSVFIAIILAVPLLSPALLSFIMNIKPRDDKQDKLMCESCETTVILSLLISAVTFLVGLLFILHNFSNKIYVIGLFLISIILGLSIPVINIFRKCSTFKRSMLTLRLSYRRYEKIILSSSAVILVYFIVLYCSTSQLVENNIIWLFFISVGLGLLAPFIRLIVKFPSQEKGGRLKFIIALFGYLLLFAMIDISSLILPSLLVNMLISGISDSWLEIIIISVIYLFPILLSYLIVLTRKEDEAFGLKILVIAIMIIFTLSSLAKISNKDNPFIVGSFKILKLGSYEAEIKLDGQYAENSGLLAELNKTNPAKIFILSSVGSEYIFKKDYNSSIIYRIPKDKVLYMKTESMQAKKDQNKSK